MASEQPLRSVRAAIRAGEPDFESDYWRTRPEAGLESTFVISLGIARGVGKPDAGLASSLLVEPSWDLSLAFGGVSEPPSGALHEVSAAVIFWNDGWSW